MGTEFFYEKDGKKQDVDLHADALGHRYSPEEQEKIKARLRAKGYSEETVASYFNQPSRIAMTKAKADE